jgi:hypothetical protein
VPTEAERHGARQERLPSHARPATGFLTYLDLCIIINGTVSYL